jgi:hypothetical protein
MRLLHKIVGDIADREDLDPEELKTPLHHAVDVDALEKLIGEATDRQDSAYPIVEFEYYGYTVTIDGTGDVTVSKPSETADDLSAQSPARSSTASAATGRQEVALGAVTDIIAAREQPFEQRLDDLLQVARETLDLESASLSYVDGDAYLFEAVNATPEVNIQAGETISLTDTVCKRAVETEQGVVLNDVEAEAPEMTTSACDIASYVGVPVFVDGAVYGTFCFYDSDPRDAAFTDWERSFVELLGSWVSRELEQRQHERAVHAKTTEQPDSVC